MDWDDIKITLITIAIILIIAVIAIPIILYGSYALKQLGLWIF